MASPVSFHSAPAFFRQGPSPLTRLLAFGILAVALMAVDRRWTITQPIRTTVANALYPLQWALVQPVHLLSELSLHLEQLDKAQQRAKSLARENLILREQSQRAAFLQNENQRLRDLLNLRQKISTKSQVAQIVFRAANSYVDRVTIDQGKQHNIQNGALVLDAYGVYGQVTQVNAMSAEVTLIHDRHHHTPVLNLRSQSPGILVGSGWGDMPLELQGIATDADLVNGDVLVTSGLDGMFPSGIPVARVSLVVRSKDESIEMVFAQALAHLDTSRDLMVLKPHEPLLPSDENSEALP